LCRIIGAFPDEWKAVRATVLKFFTEKGGYLHNTRCDMELKKARKQYEEKVERMAAARAKRWAGKRTTDQLSDLVSGQTTSAQIPSHSPGSKEPHDVSSGEAFWAAYPHPPNRGSKRRVIEKIAAMTAEDQQAALSSLTAHKRAIAETRKRHAGFEPCMAETFVNGRRWEAFDSAPPGEGGGALDIQWPDEAQARERAERLQQRVGAASFASYFGRSPPREDGGGWVVTPPGRAVADLMENRFGPALDDIYGKGAWRMER